MAQIDIQLVAHPGSQGSNRLKQLILQRHRDGVSYWRPLHARMDYWANLYLMLDPVQMSKPIGIARRFVSNEPRTGPDAALAILTRNAIGWKIEMINSEDENSEERRKIGRIERTLGGLVDDMDELFSMRLQGPMWKQIGFQALIRGMIWGKFHITLEALKYRRSPLVAEIYDSRLVYPSVDEWGLNNVVIAKPTNLGSLVATYPEKYPNEAGGASFDTNTPAVKLEFWSNDRGNRKGIMGCLAQVGTSASQGTGFIVGAGFSEGATKWVIEPMFHGYDPESLPVVGVAANGAHLQLKPSITSILEERLTERADIMAMNALNWHGPNTQVAEMGRSILSAIEEQVPQYNELIATIFQHFSIGTYGTWVFKTPTGEMPDFEPGIESKIAMTPQESIERIEPSPMTGDAYRLLGILQDERQRGVLSNVLMASTPFEGTGVLFQQITNSALNSLEPYQSAMIQFGKRAGTSILAQMQKSAEVLEPFELRVMDNRSAFRIEFDPKTDLDVNRHYTPVPAMKPALPDDITVRMTAARMALDPRRPMLSLVSVLEDILQRDDPSAEVDRIWEDMAMNDPVLLPEHMAMAFERMGEPEMAARMRETEFKAKLIEDLELRQLTGNTGGSPQGNAGFPLADPGAGGGASNTATVGAPTAAIPSGFEAAEAVSGPREV